MANQRLSIYNRQCSGFLLQAGGKMSVRNTVLAYLATVASLAIIFPTSLAHAEGMPIERARLLSPFGERPVFSPDGSRIAFVGKAYGEAYEIELETGHIRNLTSNIPHQGVVRIHYLQNGDFLVTGPKYFSGPNSRINLEMFILKRDLHTAMQPLGEKIFEGVAVGPGNAIAWQRMPAGETLNPGEQWIEAVQRIQWENYYGRIVYKDGKPQLVDKRRIMNPREQSCGLFMEVQDFRDNGREVTFYCGDDSTGEPHMQIFGYRLDTGKYIRYYRTGHYAEVEGIAPNGTWTTVECGDAPASQGVSALDICRLELVPDGTLSKLIIGTKPGTTRKVNNPVVSPDGKSVAFAAGDASFGEHGTGSGIYIINLVE